MDWDMEKKILNARLHALRPTEITLILPAWAEDIQCIRKREETGEVLVQTASGRKTKEGMTGNCVEITMDAGESMVIKTSGAPRT